MSKWYSWVVLPNELKSSMKTNCEGVSFRTETANPALTN